MLRCQAAVAMCTLLLTACAAGRSPNNPISAGQPSGAGALSALLPGVEDLPAPPRVAAATNYQLLANAPVLSGGATWSSGQLTLNPLASGFAWAIFGEAGLPTDGSAVPQFATGDSGGPPRLVGAP